MTFYRIYQNSSEIYKEEESLQLISFKDHLQAMKKGSSQPKPALNLLKPLHNPVKPATSIKPKMGLGFGFGDAMFAMKNLTADYEQAGSIPSQPVQMQISKNPQSSFKPAPTIKPTITAPTQPKITSFNKGSQYKVPNEVFKIAIGKQYKDQVKLMEVNTIKVGESVFEITPSKTASKWQYNIFCDGVPADKIVEKPEVSFSFNAQDLKQGQLGNCYFIAALASVAEHSIFLARLIPSFKQIKGNDKSFRVNIFQSGKLIEVMVDNLFPNVYLKPVGNDISPMIIEKAYAQAYGNFQVINLGFAIDAMRDLSGCPSEQISLKDPIIFRRKVKQAFESKFGLVIASKIEGVDAGLSARHSYNILKYDFIDGQLFLQLRDPRGWTKASFSLPAKLSNIYEQGIFWVGEKELQRNFQMISVGKFLKNYTYFFKTFSKKQVTNRTGGLFVYPQSNTKVYISMHQKHKKFYGQNFTYDILRLMVVEVDSNKQSTKIVRTLSNAYKSQQTCVIQLQLEAKKQYLVLGQISNNKNKDLFPNQLFTFSVLSEKPNVTFEQASGLIDSKPFITNYIINHRNEFQQQSKNGYTKYFGPVFGHICLFYENLGEKIVIQQVEYNVKNVQITDNKVKLLPNQTKLIIHPLLSQQYQCSMKSNTLYK